MFFCYVLANNITFANGRRVILYKGTFSESNEWYHHFTSVW
ncbi:hypothetical protein SM905_03655 [Klebsiella aerogenes]|nr:hypothetical protein [Klebsiella aerogenes]MDY0847688.1 hypothetical protein [Klebsiella aerogenes]WPS35501.1 hypothetical protein SM905_03655 [Klebsiella aerogenes]